MEKTLLGMKQNPMASNGNINAALELLFTSVAPEAHHVVLAASKNSNPNPPFSGRLFCGWRKHCGRWRSGNCFWGLFLFGHARKLTLKTGGVNE